MFNDPIETGFTQHTARHKARLIGLLVTGLALVLSGCGDKPQALAGGSSPSGSINEVNYNGANPPSSTDVSSFLAQFWKPMHEGGYCVECHDSNQEPKFLNSVDINVAYDFAKSKVDVTNPANSILVAQVGSGHHCWLGSSNANNKACADIVQRYIANWLGASSDAGRTIPLTAPAMVNPGASKNFPATAAQGGTSSFAATVYPLLLTNCHGCHSPTSSTPQAPFFADDDVNAAYDAAKAKIDLNEDNTRDKSRFVLRLRNEFHNCWSGDCDADATEMKNAIMVFAGGIVAIPIDISLVTSKAMTLQVPPAIIATGGNRYENGLIAFWEFKEHEGTVAYDTSGVSPAIDLSLTGDTGTWSWVDGNGIEFMPCQTGANCGKAQGDPAASKKIRDRIIQTGGTEYAIEAWVVPANVTQDKRSIVTYSNGSTQRNFTLGQSMYNYDFINHSTKTNGTDDAKLHTADADEDLQATLQHVVMNFDAVHGRQIFVNGVSTGDSDLMADIGGTITAWDGSNPGIYPLVLGSEQGGGNSAWAGKIRMLAIYNHALTPEQVRQNFTVGVGQKFILLFSIEQILGTPQYSGSYIMFDVEQYDNYAYLFSAPKFINLNSTWTPSSAIPIKGMRIAINGKEAVSGQAFANLNVSVNATDYSATNGQLLSSIGTVIASEKGIDDEFFLTFEQLGTATHTYVETNPVTPADPPDAALVSKIGVRTFDEINATMSAITGVPVTNTSVNATFQQYRRQLPAIEDIEAYLSSHQMGVAQLAMKYCDQLVETNPGYFAPFSFTQLPAVAFDTNGKNNVLNPLLKAIMNLDTPSSAKNLGSQPNETDIRNMLSSNSPQTLDVAYSTSQTFDSLIDCMTRCERGTNNECAIYISIGDSATCTGAETNNTTTRTKQVVKATCAAALGSAAMLIQ